MRKFFSLALLCATMVMLFSACSKDDESSFNYPKEDLYGTWEGIGIYYEDEWWDLTDPICSDIEFSISFFPDGKYYGSGFFGNGGGTYELDGNYITTYIEGEMYARYNIHSFSKSEVEVTMYGDSGAIRLRARKVED